MAGGSAADPKQPALISSNEQPVDVVQRTLIPEQLPLEGENDADVEAAGTPVGETEDPRLLSPEEKAAQNEGSAATGVSPRKVRTMIVKPDGTLVAQKSRCRQPSRRRPIRSRSLQRRRPPSPVRALPPSSPHRGFRSRRNRLSRRQIRLPPLPSRQRSRQHRFLRRVRPRSPPMWWQR